MKNEFNVYWGDIHNHCAISYGFGSLENALKAAREQLDFCSVTGHAMWPDMLRGEKGFEFSARYHEEGFKKLYDGWSGIRETLKTANIPGNFVTFQGYEMHSRKQGDYHILSTDDSIPIIQASSPAELVEKLAPMPAIAIPHHTGYTPGYRGCDWDHFSSDISPVVEVYSKHGCGMSDTAPYPYLHTMGPRDSRTSVFAGLRKGHRFAFAASTDHHAGYPGSYGDGRMAVLARGKTRPEIWEAILSGRTYAVTGDKIECVFKVNDVLMGGLSDDKGDREISLNVTACGSIDKIIVYKNMEPWKVINGEFLKSEKVAGRYKVRIEMGWGKDSGSFLWRGSLSIADGMIISVEPCFRGKSVLAPEPGMKEDPDINNLANSILDRSEKGVRWECSTFRNPTTMHPQTAALIVEVEGAPGTLFTFDINGITKTMSLGKMLNGGVSDHIKRYNSEAFLIHKPAPETEYKYRAAWDDREKRTVCDMYHAEIRQVNSQYAWISPVWADGR